MATPEQNLSEEEAVAQRHWKNGKLTRDGMVATILSGGTVLHGNRLITSVDQLPSAAVLAKGDSAAEAAAAEGIRAQMVLLQKQLDLMGSPAQPLASDDEDAVTQHAAAKRAAKAKAEANPDDIQAVADAEENPEDVLDGVTADQVGDVDAPIDTPSEDAAPSHGKGKGK